MVQKTHLTVSCACMGCHHQHRKVINVVIVCYYGAKTPVSLILLTKYVYQPNKIPTKLFSFLITLNLMPSCCTRLILCITSSLCWSLIHNPSMILLMPRWAQHNPPSHTKHTGFMTSCAHFLIFCPFFSAGLHKLWSSSVHLLLTLYKLKGVSQNGVNLLS